MAETPKPIFRPLDADDPDPEATVIESLCVSCQENGKTQLLLTKIPFFKEVVLISFECEHCGYKNNEIQSAGKIEEKGVRITLTAKSSADLNRQVCKSDFASVRIPELDFEIPSRSQKGEVTTVEGIIERSIQGLEQDQPARRAVDPDNADKIDGFVSKLKELRQVGSGFTMIIEDISGNSFVSNPHAPAKDTEAVTTYFVRTGDQDHALGIYRPEEVSAEDSKILKPVNPEEFAYEDMIQEVMQFQTNCPNCGSACETNMKMTNVPHFKDVVIMATVCDGCGHRTNEVKSGGGIEPKGTKIEVKISKPEDLTRDVLKSETCCLEIPEIELDVGPAALGGRFTTVEGLLVAMKEQLTESCAVLGDSQDGQVQSRMPEFLKQFDGILTRLKPCTLVLNDPAGNSYVQSLTHPDPDPNLIITQYERSFEQNEDLGLNDIKTENYEKS